MVNDTLIAKLEKHIEDASETGRTEEMNEYLEGVRDGTRYAIEAIKEETHKAKHISSNETHKLPDALRGLIEDSLCEAWEAGMKQQPFGFKGALEAIISAIAAIREGTSDHIAASGKMISSTLIQRIYKASFVPEDRDVKAGERVIYTEQVVSFVREDTRSEILDDNTDYKEALRQIANGGEDPMDIAHMALEHGVPEKRDASEILDNKKAD